LDLARNHQDCSPFPESFFFWLDKWASLQIARPDLKERTKRDYRERVEDIKKIGDIDLINGNALEWWQAASIGISPQRANERLRILKSVYFLASESIQCDFEKIAKLKRIKIGHILREMPSLFQFRQVIKSIREQGKKSSGESANMVEFLAYSGLRIGELRSLQWSDIKEQSFVVRNTKNRRQREVPIIPKLKELIFSIKSQSTEGIIFAQSSPVRALTSACVRVGVSHIRVHDLRHLFATSCIEAGVDIPTVALWLGHQDGGALAMRTYAHVRRGHSFAQAARVLF
jgi:integrase